MNVNSRPYNQSPSVTLCGPYSSYGREPPTLFFLHLIHAICQHYETSQYNFCLSLVLSGVECRTQSVRTVHHRPTQQPRRQGRGCMFAFYPQTHTHTEARGSMQTLHAVPLSAAFFIFFLLRVLQMSCPLRHPVPSLRSLPPPGDLSQPLTASGALLDWIYMICPSINGEREKEMVVYLQRVR